MDDRQVDESKTEGWMDGCACAAVLHSGLLFILLLMILSAAFGSSCTNNCVVPAAASLPPPPYVPSFHLHPSVLDVLVSLGVVNVC